MISCPIFCSASTRLGVLFSVMFSLNSFLLFEVLQIFWPDLFTKLGLSRTYPCSIDLGTTFHLVYNYPSHDRMSLSQCLLLFCFPYSLFTFANFIPSIDMLSFHSFFVICFIFISIIYSSAFFSPSSR